MRLIYGTFAIILCTILDQISKHSILAHLKTMPGYVHEVTSFFSLVLAWNHGISFGLFGQYYQYSNMIFIGINSCIIAYLYYLLITPISQTLFAGYVLIIGGAIGNLYGRIEQGAVFDFLYFHLGEYDFPAFNLADSFIFLGVCVVIYSHIKNK